MITPFLYIPDLIFQRFLVFSYDRPRTIHRHLAFQGWCDENNEASQAESLQRAMSCSRFETIIRNNNAMETFSSSPVAAVNLAVHRRRVLCGPSHVRWRIQHQEWCKGGGSWSLVMCNTYMNPRQQLTVSSSDSEQQRIHH